MKQKNSVCAIIPMYNRANYIEECLKSVLLQTIPPTQIIVVNDGSTDNTEEVLKPYLNKITYIKKENGGKSSTLNLGLRHCTSEWVWICDDDDFAAPDALEQAMTVTETAPEADFIYGHYEIFRDTDQGRIFSKPDFWKRPEEPDEKICFLEGMFTNQFAMLVKRALYEKTGPFNEELLRSQDFEMTLRLTRNAHIAYIPATLFYFRDHSGTRGAGQNTFDPAKNKETWLAYDQSIMLAVYQDYDLMEFIPSFARNESPPLQKRGALIQRALIMAKRGLWTHTTHDLQETLSTDNSRLKDEEKQLVISLLQDSTIWNTLVKNKEAQKIFQRIHDHSAQGKELIYTLSTPLLWIIRYRFETGHISDSAQKASVLIHIMGITGTLCFLFSKIRKKFHWA